MAGVAFHRNIIVVLWDFDRTLIPGFMQAPLFEHYGLDENKFWGEVKARASSEKAGNLLTVNEIIYLNHMLEYVRDGHFKGLNNEKLRELGGQIKFFPGAADCMRALKKIPGECDQSKEYGLKLEHYVISAGLRQMILGSEVGAELTDVWGCEFQEKGGVLDRISYVIDHTTKTRAVFEINKGVNRHPEDIAINAHLPEQDRRVPLNHMIYVADGPSDVPVFSLLKKNGGRTCGVFNPDSQISYEKAYKLHHTERRTDIMGRADYSAGSDVRRWLEHTVRDIAEDIVKGKCTILKSKVGEQPEH